MEVALVSAATGALRPVLGKLAALLGDEFKRFKRARGEIRFLTHELSAMDAFLQKMSEEEDPDAQDKVWMNEVRELSYDMEDSIDDFIQHVDDKDTKPDDFIGKIKHSLGKMKTRRRIGGEIQDLKKQIIEVGQRNARYKTPRTFSNTINATVDPRALAIFEHASKLVGLDEPKAEVIKLLTKEDECASTQHQPKVVSIVGSGGMGKTTLANQVYQDLKENFECHVFLSVSRNPNMMNILRTILSEVAKKDYAYTKARDEQQLLSKISSFLVDKRYFIVVDDIWKKETWDAIKCAFPVASRGIIITTTRMNDVADSCRSSFSGHIYNIKPLHMEYSRQLFHRRIFNSQEDCPSCLEEVTEQILEKCDGLPLAIIAISGLLVNKERTKHFWNQVKDSIGHSLERNPTVDGMMKVLSLSYFDLPSHLKTCLLHLSIVPEDCIVERETIINVWIAEGFINKDGKYTSHEIGVMCFNELINRSLIQPLKIDKHNNVRTFQVHDIILDFIISKSIEENFVTLVGVPNVTAWTQSKVRRLSLQDEEEENIVMPTSLVLSHVRSLTVFGDSMDIPSLDSMKYLRVLYLGGCKQLKNHHLANIGSLFLLRYLNLGGTGITELPDQIGHVRCLESLNIRGTRVSELPATIVNLTKLVHLLIDDSVKFPNGIAKMQALETLEEINPFNQSFYFLVELSQLKNLRELDLDFEATGYTEGVKEDCMNVVTSYFRNTGTQNLLSLTITGGVSFLHGPLCPTPLSLQKLITKHSVVPRVPNWMVSLINLQQLSLQVEEVMQEDLCILGHLPILFGLDLTKYVRSHGGTRRYRATRLRISGEVGFHCLTHFCYGTNQEMELMFAAGSMPKLETLYLDFHASKTKNLIGVDFDFGIKNLPCLITLGGHIIGTDVTVEEAKIAIARAASAHANRPTIFI